MNVLIYWIATIGLVLFGQVYGGGNTSSIRAAAPAIIVFAPILFFIFTSFGLKGTSSFFRRLFGQRLTQHDREVLDKTVSLGFLLGGVGMVMGTILTMENLANPSELGRGIALSFVSALYGAVPAILIIPLDHISKTQKKSSSKSALYSIFTAIFVYFSVFVVLYAQSGALQI